jgi:hypothetical protein
VQDFTTNYEKEFTARKEQKIEKNSKSMQAFHTNLEKLENYNKLLAEKKFEEKMEKYQKIVKKHFIILYLPL